MPKLLTLKTAKTICRKFGFTSLITQPAGNAKLLKSQKFGYYNCGLSLAPADMSGHNVCRGSSPFCRIGCLGHVGRVEIFSAINGARVGRTKFLFESPSDFADVLFTEMHSIDRKARKLGIPVAFRPDVLSDLLWHRPSGMPWMFAEFPEWNFYGYTKIRSKIRDGINGNLPANYSLTYSWSERANLADVREFVAGGQNVAVPFYDVATMRPTVPTDWHGMPVINGDELHGDLRFLDPAGVIVGLKAKLPRGREAQIDMLNAANGFFVGV